jgi:hypothetical protein
MCSASSPQSSVGRRFAALVTPPRRKTRFQQWVRRYWTGFYPQGSYERFPSASLHLIPLSQALLVIW